MNSDNNNNGTLRLRFPGFTGEWEEKKLSDCFTLLRNNNLSRSQLNDITGKAKNIHYGDVLVNFGDILDVEKEQIPYITDDVTAEQACRESLKNGDVIIADTAEDNTVGKCTEIINIGETPVVSGLHTIPLRPSSVFAPGYLGYYMNSQAYRVGLYPLMQGVKVTSISRNAILGTNIHFPSSLAEQKKIAECLMAVDELITAQEQKVGALKERKRGLMQQLFPQLDETTPRLRFPGFIGEWEEKEFGDLIKESRLSSKEENEDVLLTSAIDGMFLNSERFSHQRGKSTIGYRKIKRGMLVLSAQNLHLGNANVNMRFESGLVSPAYKVYTIIGCLPEFMAQWVKRDATKEFFLRATTQGASECRKNVVWEQLYKQTIPVPNNPAEQKIIADFLSQTDTLITAQSQELAVLKAHKQGLMQQLFQQPSK